MDKSMDHRTAGSWSRGPMPMSELVVSVKLSVACRSVSLDAGLTQRVMVTDSQYFKICFCVIQRQTLHGLCACDVIPECCYSVSWSGIFFLRWFGVELHDSRWNVSMPCHLPQHRLTCHMAKYSVHHRKAGSRELIIKCSISDEKSVWYPIGAV